MNMPKPPKDLFLSRLCGGEYAWFYEVTLADFLSRLCGGEYLASRDAT